MRSGKENGLLFPNTPGSSGQVLVSNGSGVISWANPSVPSNMVTTDTAQTISGAKTFTAATTTIGTSGGGNYKVTTPGSSLIFEATGGGATSRITLIQGFGKQGLQIEQIGSYDLADLVFTTSTGSSNIRYERGSDRFIDSANTAEFHFGNSEDPDLVVGDNSTIVRTSTLKVGSSQVYHQSNIPGNQGNLLFNSSGGIGNSTFPNIDSNGYLKLNTGLPNVGTTGGVTVGARDLAGRIMPAFVGPYGLDSTVQSGFFNNRIAMLIPIIGATAPTAIGQTATPTGTATARSLATTNMFTSLPRVGYVGSSNVTGSVSGFRTNQQWWRGSVANAGGFFYSCTFALTNAAAQASGRAFVGLYSSTAGSSNVEPSSMTNMIGMCRSTSSNNWMIHGANGSTNSIMYDLGSNFPAGTVSTDVYRLILFAPPNGNVVGWRVQRVNAIDASTGQPYTASGMITDTSQMPVNTAFLAAYGWSSTGTLSGTAGIDLVGLYVETDN